MDELSLESYPYSPKYNKRFDPQSGIKYDMLDEDEQRNLLLKLGADIDDIKEALWE